MLHFKQYLKIFVENKQTISFCFKLLSFYLNDDDIEIEWKYLQQNFLSSWQSDLVESSSQEARQVLFKLNLDQVTEPSRVDPSQNESKIKIFT
jgi:hypothetical protein